MRVRKLGKGVDYRVFSSLLNFLPFLPIQGLGSYRLLERMYSRVSESLGPYSKYSIFDYFFECA